VQPAGPRDGAPGKTFLNVEGKNNGRESVYASFGVLEFHPAKPDKPVGSIKGITLTLTQSIARFSKDGPMRAYIAPDTTVSLEPKTSPLKFDPKTPGGIGPMAKTILSLGTATFTKRMTGDADTITLKPETNTEAYLRSQLNGGGTIRVLLVPADDDVAATYFGAGCEPASRRPKRVIDAGP
jgi:hypothetical protein